MKEAFQAFVELLRQPPLILGTAGGFGLGFCLFLLFVSDEIAKRLRVDAWRIANGHWLLIGIGISGLLLTLAIVMGLQRLVAWLSATRQSGAESRRLKRAFAELGAEERSCMVWCLLWNKTQFRLPNDDGTAASLMHERLIVCKGIGLGTNLARYQIPSGVWAYMTAHEDEVLDGVDGDEWKAKLAHFDNLQSPREGMRL